MKHKYLLLSIFTSLFALSGCVEEPDMNTQLQNGKAPEVSDTEKLNTYASAIELKAKILKENGTPVQECGVCWSDRPETTPADNLRSNRKVKAEKVENGEFTATITSLDDEVSYYVCAYAINKADTAYSSAAKYTTLLGVGEIKTLKPDSIHATSALLGGKLKGRGEGAVTDFGLYLSETEKEPTEKDIHISYKEMKPAVDLNKIDSFVWRVTKLKPLTRYYVRAYALNKFGEFAFNTDSFETKEGKPKVEALVIDSASYTLVHLSAQLITPGDSALTAFGFCWSSTDEVPVIGHAGTDTIMSAEVKNGKFVGTIRNLESSRKYFARAYATNVFGTSYSSEIAISTKKQEPNLITAPVASETVKFGSAVVGGELQNGGDSPITKWGVCWSDTNKSPTIELDNHVTAKDTIFTCTLSKLKGGSTYYVRAYGVNENGLVGYGTVQTFTTPTIFKNKNIYAGSKRTYSAAFSLSDQAFVVGGDLGQLCSDELLGYNTDRDEWLSLTSYKAYCQMATCVNENMAYLMGGSDKSLIMNDFQSYSYSDNRWTALEPLSDDIARYDATGFSYNDSIYLLGGVSKKGISKEIWRYDLSEGSWKLITDQFPIAQKRGFAIVIDNTVYAGLGETSGLGKRGLWCSSDSLTIWEPAPGILPDKIGVVSSAVHYKNERWNSLFMIDDSGNIWEYNLTKEEWIAHTKYAERMKNYQMFILNGKIYILGQDLFITNTLKVYDPDWDH